MQIDCAEQEDYFYDPKKKKFYHYECKVQEEVEKQKLKKRYPLSELDIRDVISCKSINGAKIVKEMLDEERLYDFIHNSYGLVSIPNMFKASFDKVLSGEYKGLSRGIPVTDILEMWQRKKPELDKIYDYNIRHGKDIDRAGRLNYDLAVLISKYDSFLEWKQKEAIRGDLNHVETSNSILATPKIQQRHEVNADSDELSDLLDELF